MTSNGRIWECTQHTNNTVVLTVRKDLDQSKLEIAKAEGQVKVMVLSAIGLLLDSYTDENGLVSLWVKAVETNVEEEIAFDVVCNFHRSAFGKSLLKQIRSALPSFTVLPDPNASNAGIDENGNYVVFDPYFVNNG